MLPGFFLKGNLSPSGQDTEGRESEPEMVFLKLWFSALPPVSRLLEMIVKV